MTNLHHNTYVDTPAKCSIDVENDDITFMKWSCPIKQTKLHQICLQNVNCKMQNEISHEMKQHRNYNLEYTHSHKMKCPPYI